MTARRRTFYLWLAVLFPPFFLLHWNGLLDPTYWWALEATDATRRPAVQALAALLSALLIFAALAALFELATRRSPPRG